MKNFYFGKTAKGGVFLLTLLHLCLLADLATGQPYWKRISPKAWHEKMSVFQVHPSKRGVALGLNDHNLRSENSINWRNASVTQGSSLTPLFVEFSSDTVVWAGYQNEPLRKSKDGGRTWVNTATGIGLIEVKFLDGQTGFGRMKTGNIYKLVKTTDGGATWPEVAGPDLPAAYANISVVGANEVWATSGLYVVKTTNGGASWDSLNVGAGSNLLGAKMVTAQFGYAYAAGWIYITENGGSTWDLVSAPVALRKVQFINRLTGWCAGTTGLYKTTDGGVTWNGVNGASNNFQFINANEGWALINMGIVHSADGGVTWKSSVQVTGNSLASVDFQPNGRCWVVGYNKEILYTDNHGRTWTKAPFDSTESYHYVKFFSQTNGVIVGSRYTYRTQNGGATWEKSATPSGNSIWDVQFRDETFGYYFTAVDRKIFTTSNLGQTWVEKTTPPLQFNDVIYSVYFVDSQYGYLLMTVNDNSPGPPPFDPDFEYAYKTMDGGATWTRLINYPTGSSKAAKLRFSSRDAGFAYVSETMALRTTDGGNTFTPYQFTTTNSTIQKFVFRTDSLGYILSNKGRLLKTTNGGAQWNLDHSVLSPPDSTVSFNDIGFLNHKPIVGVGGAGIIYGDPDWYKPLTSASGKIVKKENSNCTQDANEMPLQNRIVVTQPGGYYASTDANGNYTVEAELGNNTIAQIPMNAFYAVAEKQFCPPSNAPIPVTLLAVEDSALGNNFINEVKLCPVLVLSQNQSALRPCRKGYLTISIQNQGNLVSDSEWVHIKLPPQVTLLSASIILDYNSVDSTHRFKIKPLQPGEAIAIQITDSLACNQTLMGQVLCIKATLPNVPSCILQSPGWDGADLEVASRCVNDQAKFTLHNKGASMPSASQYRIFIDSVLVYQAPFQLAANSQMTVTVPPNTAGFIRLVVPQSVNHPLSTFASAEANCGTGLSTNGLFPEPDESPVVDIECNMVRNAYDPNDKTVFPYGIGPEGKVEPEAQFKYKIRFQNTGTDTAFKVVLVDTLDAGLDIASLQLMSASHPFDFKVSGKGRPVLSWTFNNILLPDSGANQAASNGFVTFSIRPKTGLALGTRLENFADIYFDFNDPVRTNTTVNTLWRPTLVEGVLDTVFTVTATKAIYSEKDLSLFPNPSKGMLEFNAPEVGRMTLYNIRGEMMLERPVEKGTNRLELSLLPKGLYVVRFQFANQPVMRKVVLE